jgi:hypothetical protein
MMTISPTARKLAERYGVSPEVMEEIISDTRSKTDIPRDATASTTPHISQTIHTVSEPVVAVGPLPIAPQIQLAPPNLITPIVAQPVVIPPVVVPPTIVTAPERHNDNALSTLTVLLIILLILALAGLIYLWQTQHTQVISHPVADTVRIAAPRDTTPMILGVDTAKVPPPFVENQAAQTRRVRARAKRAPVSKGYTTSSALAAQEHLAELRADGNRKAYLETVNRGGNTFYRLHNGEAPSRSKRRHR